MVNEQMVNEQMKTFYKAITLIFQPLLMPTFGMIILMNMTFFVGLPPLWRWISIIGTFIFTAVLPAIPILVMLRKGEINDLFISKKEERTMPYLFSFLAYVFWSMFMWRTLQFPMFIVAMGIGSAISIIAITVINLKWKISAHLGGVGGLTGAVFGVCYRMAINPLPFLIIILAISALVALARMELKAHTPGQVLAGFVVGFLAVFLPCIFF
jgi:membrane-associated phospholipid phosphatase